MLNVQEKYRPILAAVLVATLIPGIPHPITALVGEQGTGKTTASKIIVGTLDPSTVQVRKAPKDVDTWVTAAAGSWVVALDNLSLISDQISDALCRASTGDGDVRRRLYSDGDLHVISFRRAVLLNGIDFGAVKDDSVPDPRRPRSPLRVHRAPGGAGNCAAVWNVRSASQVGLVGGDAVLTVLTRHSAGVTSGCGLGLERLSICLLVGRVGRQRPAGEGGSCQDRRRCGAFDARRNESLTGSDCPSKAHDQKEFAG